MTSDPNTPRGPRQPHQPEDPAIDRDLAALAARSRRNMRPLSETLTTLARVRERGSWEDHVKMFFGFLGARPGLAFGSVVAVVALALLLIPISYERVVGHDVTLTVGDAGMTPEITKEIAGQMKSALHAESVRVRVEADDTGKTFSLTAQVPAKAGKAARAAGVALARALTAKGYTAEASMSPVKQKVSGNVYAMVANNVVRVSMDGKTDDELEAEITQKLADAGLPNAQVSVESIGENGMKIEVKAEHEGSEMPEHEPLQLVLTKNGQDLLDGEGSEAVVRIHKIVENGEPRMVVDVEQDGRAGTAIVVNSERLDDAALSAEIARQLTEQGFGNVSVTSENGRIQIQNLAPQGAPTDEKSTSWGTLKGKYGSK